MDFLKKAIPPLSSLSAQRKSGSFKRKTWLNSPHFPICVLRVLGGEPFFSEANI